MTSSSETFAILAGGLGLLLLGLSLLTDGLMLAVGRPLERLLDRHVRSPLQVLAAGLAAAAAVPGPALLTAATAVQLDAGRLPVARAVWRLFATLPGAAVLVALVATVFGAVSPSVGLDTFGLPLIAIGALLRLAGAGRRHGAVGEVLAGIGLVLFGLALLQDGFIALKTPIGDGVRIAILLAVLGTLLAVMLPSAPAPLLLALVAVQSGVLTLTGAAFVVVGALVGTAMTTLLGCVGASPNARRVAVVQAVLLAASAVAGLVVLPLFAWLAGNDKAPALALYVAVAAALPVAAFAPFVARLAPLLVARVPDVDDTSAPRPLDDALLAAPPVAVEAHSREVERLTVTTRRLLRGALGGQPPEALLGDRRRAEALDGAADRFADALHRTRLDATLSRQLGRMRRCQHDQRASLRHAITGAAWSGPMRQVPDAASSCSDFTARALRLLDALDADRDPAIIAERLADTRAAGEATRLGLVTSAAAGAIDIDPMAATLRWHSAMQAALDLQALAGRRPAPAAAESHETQPAPLTEAAETVPTI